MKKRIIWAFAAVVLVSCSSDELINNEVQDRNVPISFNVEKRNITRAKNLEELGHYNFGVWAYKDNGGVPARQLVMDNYLVGFSDGHGVGYDNSGSSTWDSSIGDQDDHTSPWFYENLGTAEYKNTDALKGYVNTLSDYMSANANQYLRYWDLAYTITEFFAYAPYRSSGVSFDDHHGKITVAHDAQTAGYNDASLQEFIYAGAFATNSDLKDVKLEFKHLGAQLNLNFYEDVRGYRVEIIDVTTDGTGIQATPATKSGDTYTKASYYTDCGATIDYHANSTISAPKATVNHEGASTTQDNLKFAIPGTTGNNLESITATLTGKSYNVIPEATTTGTQNYAVSPTVYYPVAQPEDSNVGFTFHVSYKLIAQDNGEEITVHDARVYVPAKSGSTFIAAWQPNTKYTYVFKITENATGTTNPESTVINVNDPKVPAVPALYPIVFDGATVEDYTANETEY